MKEVKIRDFRAGVSKIIRELGEGVIVKNRNKRVAVLTPYRASTEAINQWRELVDESYAVVLDCLRNREEGSVELAIKIIQGKICEE